MSAFVELFVAATIVSILVFCYAAVVYRANKINFSAGVIGVKAAVVYAVVAGIIAAIGGVTLFGSVIAGVLASAVIGVAGWFAGIFIGFLGSLCMSPNGVK